MQRSNAKYYLTLLFAVLTVVGIWMMVNSPSWGLNEAESYLANHGGSIDTSKFVVLMQSYQTTYRLLGAITFALGGFFFLKSLTSFAKTDQ